MQPGAENAHSLPLADIQQTQPFATNGLQRGRQRTNVLRRTSRSPQRSQSRCLSKGALATNQQPGKPTRSPSKPSLVQQPQVRHSQELQVFPFRRYRSIHISPTSTVPTEDRRSVRKQAPFTVVQTRIGDNEADPHPASPCRSPHTAVLLGSSKEATPFSFSSDSSSDPSPAPGSDFSPPPQLLLSPVCGPPAGVLRVKNLTKRTPPPTESVANVSGTTTHGLAASQQRKKSGLTNNSKLAAEPRENKMGNRFSSNGTAAPAQESRPREHPADGTSAGSGGDASQHLSSSSSGPHVNVKPKPPSAQRLEIEAKDADWSFQPPPNSQRTFFFSEDNIEFSSEFDSGNLIQVERVGTNKYNMYTAMDCSNDERQANNRQWFHFSIRGGAKGSTVSVTVVGLMHCNMYTYEWMPVMAVLPNRPAYVRMPGKATALALDAVPATPGYPMLVYRDPAERRRALEGVSELDEDGGDGEEDGNAADEDEDGLNAASPTDQSPRGEKENGKKKKKKKPVAMNLSFDIRIDYDIPLQSEHPLGHPHCPAMYIASNHPYAYSTLQTNLLQWQRLAASRAGAASTSDTSSTAVTGKHGKTKVWNYQPNYANGHQQDIYFHREVLCKTLEDRNVDLITITDMNGVQGGAKESAGDRMPMLTFNGEATPVGLPYSSAHKATTRPRRFNGKQYVVLSARVHAGECPGSHMMHGCLEFLMNPKDPRALALRKHFVFFLVPMLNPDGVVRGHSRVDANGVDLNRMYRTPTYKRHPAAYSLWALLSSLAAERKLALYVDMHAHANKRGTFLYANGMDAASQVDNLLYSKLVAMNTPYLDFKNCNYSESNMSAVTRSGLSKDCSCRVVLYTEAEVLLSYAIETSYVAAKTLNLIEPLEGIPGEEIETIASLRYSPATFNDVGKAMLLGLIDIKGLNPVSRVPLSPYQSVKGISLWLQRQLQVELSEKLFAIAYKEHGRVDPADASQTVCAAILAQLTPEDIPERLTVRGCRHLPPTTVSNFKDFIPLDLASTLLGQTPPTGPPRSFLSAPTRRKTGAAVGARTSPNVAVSTVADLPPSSLYTVDDSPPANRPLPVMAQPISSNAGKKRSASERSQENRAAPVDEIAAAVMEAKESR